MTTTVITHDWKDLVRVLRRARTTTEVRELTHDSYLVQGRGFAQLWHRTAPGRVEVRTLTSAEVG